nr:phospholipase-like protein [Tanacetum cinerariifolium]
MTYILTELRPNQKGLQKAMIFFKWYTPRARPVEYGGLLGDYLKKLSPSRTLREKDKEAWSGTHSSSKEVSLQTRVKDLEGLCNSLMILPMEIKSLKARVYKLETIINVITPKTKAINVKHKVNTAGTKVITPKTKATNVKHKVNTAGTKDKVKSVGKQCDLDDKCWSDKDGNFFITPPNWVAAK